MVIIFERGGVFLIIYDNLKNVSVFKSMKICYNIIKIILESNY